MESKYFLVDLHFLFWILFETKWYFHMYILLSLFLFLSSSLIDRERTLNSDYFSTKRVLKIICSRLIGSTSESWLMFTSSVSCSQGWSENLLLGTLSNAFSWIISRCFIPYSRTLFWNLELRDWPVTIIFSYCESQIIDCPL